MLFFVQIIWTIEKGVVSLHHQTNSKTKRHEYNKQIKSNESSLDNIQK